MTGINKKTKEELYEYIQNLSAENERLKTELSSKAQSQVEYSFSTIAASMQDIICIHQFDGTIDYVNPYGLMKLGFSSEELIGENVILFIDEDAIKETLRRQNNRISGDLTSTSYRQKIIKKNGETIPVSVLSSTFVQNDQKRIILIIHDITEKLKKEQLIEEQEKRFRVFFDNSPLPVFQYDTNGIMLDFNHEFMHANGFPRDELLGMNIFDRLPDPELIKALKIATKSGDHFFEGKFYSSKLTDDVWIKIHLRGVKNHKGIISSVIGLVENITSRIKDRNAIIKAQNNLEKAEQIANFGHWEYDIDNKEISISKGAAAIWGFEKQEYTLTEIFLSPLTEYRKVFRNAMQDLIVHRTPFNIEFKIRRKLDHKIRNIQTIAEFNPEENVIFGVVRDITDNKEQEIALKESEERFRTLFVENSSPMLLIDPNNGNIIEINNAAEEFYGYPMDVINNMRIQDINSLEGSEVEEEIRKAKQGQKTVFHFKHKLASGEIRDVEVYSGIVNLNRRELLYTTVHDITQKTRALKALRDNEERLRLALFASQQGLWDVNLLDLSVEISPEYATMLGHDPEHFHITLLVWENNLHPDDLEITKDKFYGYMNGIYRDYQVDFRLKTKSGKYKWIMSTGKIISWDEYGKPTRMIGIHTDISHIKAVELELLAAKEKAEESNRLKTSFLQNMSHEIRTPMNGIMGFSELLLEEKLSNEERLEYAEIIHRNSEQLLRIVNDILDISRLESEQLQINKTNFDLIVFLNDQYKFYQPQMELKNLVFKLILHSKQEKTCTLNSDSSRLKQIIDNLLNNAMKFTEKGHIHLGLKEDDRFYTIYVEDSGFGIPEKELSNIFNRFEQSHSHVIPGGTGLGLSISKKLANLLGGNIQVESTEKEGSRFSLTLPKA